MARGNVGHRTTILCSTKIKELEERARDWEQHPMLKGRTEGVPRHPSNIHHVAECFTMCFKHMLPCFKLPLPSARGCRSAPCTPVCCLLQVAGVSLRACPTD